MIVGKPLRTARGRLLPTWGTAAPAPTTYDLTSYYAAMSVQPSTDMKLSLQTLMNNLKAAGITTKMRALYPAIHDAQSALINVINPAEIATVVGLSPPIFTENGGYQGSAIDGAINSGIADNNAAPWMQDAASMFAYCNVQPSSPTGVTGQIFGLNGTSATRISGASGAATSGRIHAATANTGTRSDSFGLTVIVRINSTTTILYRDGNPETPVTTTASSALTAGTFRLFQNNVGFGDAQVPVWGMGGILNDTDNDTFAIELFNFLDPWGAS